jgi:hypothetical protein
MSKRFCSLMRFFVFMAAITALTACGDDDGSASGDGGVDGAVDGGGDASLEVELYPEMDPLKAYSSGPSLILAQVAAASGLQVDLSVSVDPQIPAKVVPQQLVGGQADVAEVFLRPTEADVGQTFTIELRGEGDELVETATVGGEVIDWQEGSAEHPDSLLQVFLEYIEQNHPALGLDRQTTLDESWAPHPQILVVGHRAYLYDNYHLHLAWHVTIAPHDWAYVTVRPRDQLEPSMAFCLPSQSEDQTVQQANLDDPRLPCAQ